MKIGGHFITSLASYRKHFDFNSVWAQLDVFIRDMSPENVPYLKENNVDNDAKLVFEGIAFPANLKIENNSIVLVTEANKEVQLLKINNQSALELEFFEDFSFIDRARILLLFELAEINIASISLSQSNTSFADACQISLCNGSSIKVIEGGHGEQKLHLRKIYVDSQSCYSSTVDGVEIQPGKFVYGVFSKVGLHLILPPIVQNAVYKIWLSEKNNGNIETIVFNKRDDTISHMINVKSFCTVGKDNYAYIENNVVYCQHDENLAKKLAKAVGILDRPLFVESDNDFIFITFNNGVIKKINI
jgi:hypothetical protein